MIGQPLEALVEDSIERVRKGKEGATPRKKKNTVEDGRG